MLTLHTKQQGFLDQNRWPIEPRLIVGAISFWFGLFYLKALGESFSVAALVCVTWLASTFIGTRLQGGVQIVLCGKMPTRREDRWTHGYLLGLVGYSVASVLLSNLRLVDHLAFFVMSSTAIYGLSKLACARLGCCYFRGVVLPLYEGGAILAWLFVITIYTSSAMLQAFACAFGYVVVRSVSVGLRKGLRLNEFPFDIAVNAAACVMLGILI